MLVLVGRWESRALCGISKRGGKVYFWTFPGRVFSIARDAAFWVEGRGSCAMTNGARPGIAFGRTLASGRSKLTWKQEIPDKSASLERSGAVAG